MLAAECAWTILRTEHARMRELLTLLDERSQAADWQKVGELIDRLEAFEKATHSPKGVVLLGLLRGRSAEADALLDQLSQDSSRCHDLLAQAKVALQGADADAQAAKALHAILDEHRQLMLSHFEREDTLLHSHTAQLITREEWAAVVSSMSAAMGAAARRN
jgi:hemerythrin-like domain-containing protein